MPVPGDHKVCLAGNRAFQDTVVRLIHGNRAHCYRGSHNLRDLGDQLEVPDDLAFLSLKPAQDLGNLAHDGRGNQQDKPSFDLTACCQIRNGTPSG